MKQIAGIVAAMVLLGASGGLQADEVDIPLPPAPEEEAGEPPPELLALLGELDELSGIEGHLRRRWKQLIEEWPKVEQRLNQLQEQGKLDEVEKATDEALDKIGYLADQWYRMLLQADLWWQKFTALEQQWKQEGFEWLGKWEEVQKAWQQGRPELLAQWQELERWRHQLIKWKWMLERKKI